MALSELFRPFVEEKPLCVMPRRTPTALALALCAATLNAGEDPKEKAKKEAIAKELKALEGTWEIVLLVNGGRKVQIPKGKRERWTFRGDALVPEEGGDGARGTLKVDPGKTPKAMDITATDGFLQGKTSPAIYELKGDELRVCVAPHGHARPTEFSAEKGVVRSLVTYRRVKPKQ